MSDSMQVFHTDSEQPFDSLGLFTYLRTYARRHEEENVNSTLETWKECLTRVVNACNTQLNVGFTPEESQEFFNLLYNLKCSVAGRFLWQLGTRTVDKLGLMSLQNCAFTVIDEPVKPFTWIMNFLMLGAGCGYRISQEDIAKFPLTKHVKIERQDVKDADYIVPDSRQGWIKLLGKVLKAHFYSGEGFTYSCHLLRSKGAPIKGFGGLSSGPEVLCDGISKINSLLNSRVGQQITSVDALDIANIIGMIVVSGNVRRSAQIAIGDASDKEYMKAKRWDLHQIPNWRCYSNNSVICNDIAEIIDNDDFWAGYNGNGEPYGLINLRLSRSCGRLGETQYPDPSVDGFNPCAEQSLAKWETCCLGEIYLPNISSYDELKKCVKYVYRTCKHSLSLPCADSKETEDIVHNHYRMGIGITGYLQATENQRNWLKHCYEYLREYDDVYSKMHGFPPSIKLTTCKPSGCSRRDSMILTNFGLLRLDELGDVNGPTWQDHMHFNSAATDHTRHNFEQHVNYERITKFFVNGTVLTKKIKTLDGFELESSLNHQYRVITRDNEYVWKTVESLNIGDRLAVEIGGFYGTKRSSLKIVPQHDEMKQPVFDNTHETESIIPYLQMTTIVDDDHVEYRLRNYDHKFIKFVQDIGLRNRIKTTDVISVYSKTLVEWMTTNNLTSDGVPRVIRTGSLESIHAYLSALREYNMAVLGSITFSNTYINTGWSEKWAHELAVLYRSMGYCLRIVKDQERYHIMQNEFDPARWRYGFWLDPISSLEESSCPTYDIEVENAHHYRLNGFVSHNTLSILGHCTSGVHPGFARYYIRRIRVSSESKLIQLATSHGYPVEYVQNFDGTLDYNTRVISFPYALPEGTVLAENCTAVQQLEYVKRLQSEWSDNAVSVTVYYKKEELSAIKEWLRANYNDNVKTVSFLLHSEHGFKQAPLEKITKEEYDRLMETTRPIVGIDGICYNEGDQKFVGEGECAGGACPLK